MIEYIALFLLCCVIYSWLTKDHDYWEKRGVPFHKPKLLVGNMGEAVIMKKSFGYVYWDFYKKYEGHPYIGLFNMRTPTLLMRDLDLIKEVLVSQFNKFHDIPMDIDEKLDPLITKNPFFLKGDRWKIVRAQITPLLTNAKMKAMFPLIQENCRNLVKYAEEESKAMGKAGLEAKELGVMFATDNVVSCAYGLQANSFIDPNAVFRRLSDSIFDYSVMGLIRYTFTLMFPEMSKLLKVSAPVVGIPLNRGVPDKFKKLIMEAITYRKENQVERNDFLDSIIELKSKPMPFEYTPDHMVSHALTLFLDGSDTSATVFSFTLLALAANPDVQRKLKEEIDSMLDKYSGEITFEAIQEMSYLDAIFLETLRIYPPLFAIARRCTESCSLSYTDSSGTARNLTLDKGTPVVIPVLPLHRDSRHYPDPDNFNPDRFTGAAKQSLLKNCYFGFGDGPRICLGRRFANMQIKAGLIAMVSNFEIRLNDKTSIPIEFDKALLSPTVKEGIWLNFYKRVSSK